MNEQNIDQSSTIYHVGKNFSIESQMIKYLIISESSYHIIYKSPQVMLLYMWKVSPVLKFFIYSSNVEKRDKYKK